MYFTPEEQEQKRREAVIAAKRDPDEQWAETKFETDLITQHIRQVTRNMFRFSLQDDGQVFDKGKKQIVPKPEDGIE